MLGGPRFDPVRPKASAYGATHPTGLERHISRGSRTLCSKLRSSAWMQTQTHNHAPASKGGREIRLARLRPAWERHSSSPNRACALNRSRLPEEGCCCTARTRGRMALRDRDRRLPLFGDARAREERQSPPSIESCRRSCRPMKEQTHEEDLSPGGDWHRIAGCRYIRKRTRNFNYDGRVERSRSQAMLGRRQ